MNNHPKIFIFGFLAALCALIFEVMVIVLFSIFFNIDLTENYFKEISLWSAGAVFIEESFKIIFLLKILPFNRNSQPHLILMALFFGIGFSLIEFVVQKNALFPNMLEPSVILMFSLIPLVHIATVLIAFYLLSRPRNNLLAKIIAAFIAAFSIHLLFNLMIIQN